MKQNRILWIAVACLLICGSLVAHADFTRKHKSSSQSWGAYESTSADYYQADRSAEGLH
ncbi:MAG TPA: hypothetical protein VF398_00100 [bacterium]|jgi:hypothetical protein